MKSSLAKNKNHYYKLPALDGLEMLDAKRHTQSFPFHSHQTFNITLVIDQVFSTSLERRRVYSQPGTIVVTHPNEVHATDCDPNLGNSFFTFYVSPEVMKELNGNQPVRFDSTTIDDEDLFARLQRCMVMFHTTGIIKSTALLGALRTLISRHHDPGSTCEKKTVLFQNFLQDISLDKFSLDASAKRFGLDRFKFLRLFKQQTGLTPGNYITLRRIERSKLLLHTDRDLLSVAIEAGFYDTPHFSRHFRRVTGVSPAIYREAMSCNFVQQEGSLVQ